MLAASLLPANIEHTDANILAAMQKLCYPVLATLKKDGIRALRFDGSLLSRTRKPIPNRSIRERSLVLPGGFDMELWNPSLRYDEIESIVMSREHPDSDKIQFHILDWFASSGMCNYAQRMYWLQQHKDREMNLVYEFEFPTEITNAQLLLAYFLFAEQQQGEGICFRTPNSPYKQARSTLKEQYLIKLSRYLYSEATIVGFVEQQENSNYSTTSRLGLSERSSHASGMIGKNTLGALMCQLSTGESISIGTGVGLTNELRRDIWLHQNKYLGCMVKFKHKFGQKNIPRSPVMCGFRSPIDT
jgi:hypothetical protein